MLSNEEDLRKMNEEGIKKKISILKCSRFWRESGEQSNLRSNFSKGREKIETEGGYCMILTVASVN